MKIKQNQSLTEDKSINNYPTKTTTTTTATPNISLNTSQSSTTPTARQTFKKKKPSLCVSNTNEYTKMMDTQQISDVNLDEAASRQQQPEQPAEQQPDQEQQQGDSLISEEASDEERGTRSVGICTDTADLRPCEPGTNILLEGIVWNETSKGVLILNVSWRGKTFVGSLIDAAKTSWAPPRFKDIPKFKQNKEAYPFFSQYGANTLYSSSDSPFNPFVPQPNQNGLSTDPTVRTLRNGKRRYINRFESDLMSDLEFDMCSTNGAAAAAAAAAAATQQPTTPVNVKEVKPKESHSSASSVNEEEFDAMTQSSTASSTSSKCSNKSGGKKAKLNNGDAKSTTSNSSARGHRKNKKLNADQTLNGSHLDDTLSNSMVQGRHTPVNSDSGELPPPPLATPTNVNAQELKT